MILESKVFESVGLYLEIKLWKSDFAIFYEIVSIHKVQ